jgi:hypothetical protein
VIASLRLDLLVSHSIRREVVDVTSNAEEMPKWLGADDHVPAEELARRQGAQPIESVESMARDDIFESDEELDEFLADLYESRRRGVA